MDNYIGERIGLIEWIKNWWWKGNIPPKCKHHKKGRVFYGCRNPSVPKYIPDANESFTNNCAFALICKFFEEE